MVLFREVEFCAGGERIASVQERPTIADCTLAKKKRLAYEVNKCNNMRRYDGEPAELEAAAPIRTCTLRKRLAVMNTVRLDIGWKQSEFSQYAWLLGMCDYASLSFSARAP